MEQTLDRIDSDPRHKVLISLGYRFFFEDDAYSFDCPNDSIDGGNYSAQEVLDAAWMDAGENTLLYKQLYQQFIADVVVESPLHEENQYVRLDEAFELAWKKLSFTAQCEMLRQPG